MTTDLYSVPAANGVESNLLRTAPSDDATASSSNASNSYKPNGTYQKPDSIQLAAEQQQEELFSPSLIPADILFTLPEGYTVRPLRRSDYSLGYLDVLSVLTTVGNITEDAWNERYDYLYKRNDEYYLIVICDGAGKIVGTGSLVVERKFIHSLGLVGHIEDIAVAHNQQGKKLGLRIIQTLDHIASKVGCYKTILDCSEVNEGFYVKCGFRRAGLEMAHYY